MAFDYDLLVIGAGPGGLSGAKRAAKYGAKVAVIERLQVGGVCLNQGCIKKKLIVYAADFARRAEDAVHYGWQIETGSLNWQRFSQVRDEAVRRMRDRQEESLLQAGVEMIRGNAAFIDPHTVEVGDRQLSADKILIAVGGKPIQPDIPGIEYTITSREILNLPQLPQRLAIIGGGYIGVEIGSALRSFGVEVTLMDHENCILKGFDDDLRHRVRDGLSKRGIQSLFNTTVKQIDQGASGLKLHLTGDVTDSLTVDTILCAIGRVPNLEGLALDKAGVEVQHQAIAVNEDSRTSQPHIYAVGDCTQRLPLTPVARAEGVAFADTVFGDHPRRVNYNYVPSAVFSHPEAASVGLTEAEAREKYGDDIQCFCKDFQPLYGSLSQSPEHGMVKVIVRQSSDQLLGVHMVGEHAAEIIQSVTPSVQKGMTKHELDNVIGIHPSSAEELFNYH